jgi:hypothetical protein
MNSRRTNHSKALNELWNTNRAQHLPGEVHSRRDSPVECASEKLPKSQRVPLTDDVWINACIPFS